MQLFKGLIRFVLDFPVVETKGVQVGKGKGVAWMQAGAGAAGAGGSRAGSVGAGTWKEGW